jgi:ribosomal-protein-alanine N-acetyltransferase
MPSVDGGIMIISQTPRLILRQFTWDDLDDIAAILADPIGMKHIGPGIPKTREQVTEWMTAWIQDSTYGWSAETLKRVPQLSRAIERNAQFSMWATIDRVSGRLIGRCGLLAWNLDGQLEVEVGYHLARDFWGRGLATEAAAAVRDYGFDALGFDRLISIIKPDNLASQRVATKVGMKFEKDTMVKEWPVKVYAMGRDDRHRVGNRTGDAAVHDQKPDTVAAN